MAKRNRARNREILALWGRLTQGQIALRLGVSRCVVAGVIWRKRVPCRLRRRSPTGSGATARDAAIPMACASGKSSP